jgi:hypothetical protein
VSEPVFLDLHRKFEAPGADEQPIVLPAAFDPAAWVARNVVPHHPPRLDR